jgi:hypothetical protein
MKKLSISIFLIFFVFLARASAADDFDYRSLIIEMTNTLVHSKSLSSKDANDCLAYFDTISQYDQDLAIKVGQDALYFEDVRTNRVQKPEEAALFFSKLAEKYR